MSPTLELATQLAHLASVTPEDAGCQHLLIQRLRHCGFQVEEMPHGEVSNFWATWGTEGPLLVFAGHTDVVPPGAEKDWKHPPFSAHVADGMLYGRGAADMKGSLAAMVTACERILDKAARESALPDTAVRESGKPGKSGKPGNGVLKGRLGFLVTSDEEGDAIDGTRRVIDTLQGRGVNIDFCIVGEPSSKQRLGDMIRVGRRGSLSGKMTVTGVQGHVAYPDLARNPLHRLLRPLDELCRTEWDQGNEAFPATSFQVSNIHGGTGAENVIPGAVEVWFNLRFSTELDEAEIRRRTEAVLDRHGLDYRIDWRLSGKPFLTRGGRLIEATMEAVRELEGMTPEASTGGGTSDGRFIAPTGAEVVELGPINATIHKVNECVAVEDLDRLSRVYQRIIEKLLCP